MLVSIQPLCVTKDNFLLKEYLYLLLTYCTVFIFICILFYLYFTLILIFILIIFIILNNHVIAVHTCVDVTP